MDLRRFAEHDRIQDTDADRGPEQRVIVAFAKLADIHRSGIEGQSL